MVIMLTNKQNDFEDIEPKEFYDLACELEQIKEKLSSTESAVNRNIYMRIYYSVYLFIREWLKKHTPYQSKPKGEHRRLANYVRFHGPFSRDINESIYFDLILLKKLRHQADYKLKVPYKYTAEYQKWDFTSISAAFNIAEEIIETFKS